MMVTNRSTKPVFSFKLNRVLWPGVHDLTAHEASALRSEWPSSPAIHCSASNPIDPLAPPVSLPGDSDLIRRLEALEKDHADFKAEIGKRFDGLGAGETPRRDPNDRFAGAGEVVPGKASTADAALLKAAGISAERRTEIAVQYDALRAAGALRGVTFDRFAKTALSDSGGLRGYDHYHGSHAVRMGA